MQSFMKSKTRLPFERLATCWKTTHKRFLPSMDPLMSLKVELLAKSLSTADNVAHEWSSGGRRRSLANG